MDDRPVAFYGILSRIRDTVRGTPEHVGMEVIKLLQHSSPLLSVSLFNPRRNKCVKHNMKIKSWLVECLTLQPVSDEMRLAYCDSATAVT